MLDAIPVMTLAFGAVFAWAFCMINKRVFVLWRVAAPLAMAYLGGYVFFAMIGTGSRMVLWSGIEMDRITLALSLAPVFVWPMELRSLRLMRAGGDRGGISAAS